MQTIKLILTDTMFRFFTELIPLFIVTYTAHMLEPEAFGVQTWTYAVVTMLLSAVMTVIRFYGRTELAKLPADKRGNSVFFWGLYIRQVVVLVILTSVFALYIHSFASSEYRPYLFMQLFLVLGAVFDIAWLFDGVHKLRIVTRRNALTQMLRLVLLIFLVKSPTDLGNSILLISLTTVVANLLLWLRLPNYLVKVPFRSFFILRRGLPTGLFSMALPRIGLQLNKVVLGISNGVVIAGLYYAAEAMIKVSLALVLGLSRGMLHVASQQQGAGDVAGVQRSIKQSVEVVLAISILLCVGVSQVGPEVVYWFLGIGYWEAGIAIHILAFTIPVIGLRYSLALQQMAIERDFSGTSVQVQTGAVINIALTLILIPSFGIRGAAITALLSEGISLSLQYLSLRQTLKIGDVLSGGWRFLIAGLITYVGLGQLFQVFYYPWPTFSFFEAALGGLIYLVVLAMLFLPNFIKLNK